MKNANKVNQSETFTSEKRFLMFPLCLNFSPINRYYFRARELFIFRARKTISSRVRYHTNCKVLKVMYATMMLLMTVRILFMNNFNTKVVENVMNATENLLRIVHLWHITSKTWRNFMFTNRQVSCDGCFYWFDFENAMKWHRGTINEFDVDLAH